MLRLALPWLHRPAPGIATQHPLPPHVVRAVRDALAAVDLDIELSGTVSADTVNKVRAARLELAYADALRAACLLPTPADRRYACDAAHAKYEAECEALGLELTA
jgi:hypothetical protein